MKSYLVIQIWLPIKANAILNNFQIFNNGLSYFLRNDPDFFLHSLGRHAFTQQTFLRQSTLLVRVFVCCSLRVRPRGFAFFLYLLVCNLVKRG